jgi:phosphate transport system substrate-binding protein
MKKFIIATAIGCSLLGANAASARENIRIVGSSTVYPFVTAVAEEFGKRGAFQTPIVESTGTGGGFKLFCEGVGAEFSDAVNASRPIKDSEKEQCKKGGVSSYIEIPLGFDGIAIASSKKSWKNPLTSKQLFLALALEVPQNGKLVKNPNQTWNQIDPAFPAEKIEVYGPSPTSGTRDSFVELVMEKACSSFPEFNNVYSKSEERKKACGRLREDGGYIDSGENDNLIVQKIVNNPKALGIFGFEYLEQNRASIQAHTVDGIAPDFDTIADGRYPISRRLYVYAKTAHIQTIKGFKEFLDELLSERALGDTGYLALKGLIPLPEEERKAVRARVLGAIEREAK